MVNFVLASAIVVGAVGWIAFVLVSVDLKRESAVRKLTADRCRDLYAQNRALARANDKARKALAVEGSA
jgi:hypothetical protein